MEKVYAEAPVSQNNTVINIIAVRDRVLELLTRRALTGGEDATEQAEE